MKKSITSIDIQRNEFVKTLYDNLRKTTRSAIDDHKRISKMASNYFDDGLETSEIAELLILDTGIGRETAMKYASMAEDRVSDCDGEIPYNFTFEDVYGNIVSSYEIGKIITASSDDDAWKKAEEFINNDTKYDAESIVDVNRISA